MRNQASVLQRLKRDRRKGRFFRGLLATGIVALAPVLLAPLAGAQPASPAPPAGQAAKKPAPLTEARRLYNLGRYEAAIEAANEAMQQPAARPQALLLLGRSRLERFRQTSEPAELTQARDALSAADASLLDARDRLELLVGLGQALYLDSEFRAAAEVFTGAIDNAAVLGPQARDQLLDWWATALDRHAQTRPVTDRPPIYDRLVAQMEQELRKDASAASASYWLAAGLRLRGDLERAWDAALAGWVRSLLTPDRGAALRPDLDELMRDGIIPDRARRATPAGQEADQTLATMLEEWEAFKREWGG